MTAPKTDANRLGLRIQEEVERTIQRGVNGVRYLSSDPPEVGLSPKDQIYARGTFRLFHYRPKVEEVYRVPVLLVMSLVSKSYIFDLTPGQSMVEFLLERGYDVYMIDWGEPRAVDSSLRLEDYVLDFIPDCVEQVLQDSGEPDVTVVGYCMGATMSLIHVALDETDSTSNFVSVAGPFNYEGMGYFKEWSDPRFFDVDRLVDTLGNIPASVIAQSFEMMRPVSRAVSQVRLWDRMWDEDFVHSFRVLDRWANDQIDFPGECFRQMTKDFQWDNKLYKGELRLRGRKVDLNNIRVPFLNVMAEHDQTVPLAAARELTDAVASKDRQDIVLKGGHVSLLAGPGAAKRMWPALDTWLAPRSV